MIKDIINKKYKSKIKLSAYKMKGTMLIIVLNGKSLIHVLKFVNLTNLMIFAEINDGQFLFREINIMFRKKVILCFYFFCCMVINIATIRRTIKLN